MKRWWLLLAAVYVVKCDNYEIDKIDHASCWIENVLTRDRYNVGVDNQDYADDLAKALNDAHRERIGEGQLDYTGDNPCSEKEFNSNPTDDSSGKKPK